MTDRTSPEYDALIDELDATVMMMGRLFSARHGAASEGASDAVGTSTGCPTCHTLTPPQLALMRTLTEHESMNITDLAVALGIKPPATSSAVDGLERAGLVARHHDSSDRRVIHVLVTDEGRTAMAAAEKHRREHMRRYMSVLDVEDIREFIRIQRKLIDAMVSDQV